MDIAIAGLRAALLLAVVICLTARIDQTIKKDPAAVRVGSGTVTVPKRGEVGRIYYQRRRG